MLVVCVETVSRVNTAASYPAGGGDISVLRQLKNPAQTLIDGTLQAQRQLPDLLRQETTIEGQKLGNIDDRVAEQARQISPQQHIAWGVGKIRVAGDHRDYYGLNAAAIEGVCLNDKHRTPVTRLGATGLGQVGPPDFSSLNLIHFYQESLLRELSWARCNRESTFAGCREYTSFRRSVMASACWRLRKSASAAAYN
jgi:hypothetical protein